MQIKREKFREFEFKKWLYFELPSGDAAKAAEAGKEKEAGKEAGEKKPDVEDKSAVIKDQRKEAERYINVVIGAVSVPNKEGYRAIANKLLEHAKNTFDRISTEYNAQRETIGSGAFEKSPQAQKLEAEARQVLPKIKERLDHGYETYARHQTRQDRIDSAKAKEKDKDPEKKKEAAAELQKVKEEIITDYLNQAKDTKDLSRQMKAMLARFIAKGNLIQFEYADIDENSYAADVEAYFRDVDRFHERIGSKLEGKIGDVIKMFLAELPNTEELKQEKDLFATWIVEDKGLRELLGDPADSRSLSAKAISALAQRFDVRFDANKKIAYATDLTARPSMVVYDGEGLKNRVLLDLKGGKFSTPQELANYTESVNKQTEWLSSRRKTIGEGDTFLNIGKVNSWDDWQGHKEAEYLMTINDHVRSQVNKIEKQQNEKKSQERVRAAKEMVEKGLIQVCEEAGITKKRFEGFKMTQTGPNIEDSKPTQLVINLEKGNEKMTITVDYKKPGDGKITLNMEAGQFKQTAVYDKTTDFKSVDLSKVITETKDRIDGNLKKYNEASKAISEILKQVKGITTVFEDTPTSEMLMDPNYKVPELKLMIGRQIVGHVIFKDGKTTAERNSATLSLTNIPAKTVLLAQLAPALNQSMPKMKQIAEGAERNQKEITAQANAELGSVLPGEGLTINKIANLTGDFGKPDGRILVATLNKKNNTLAAELFINVAKPQKAAGAKEEPKRQYVLKADGKDAVTGDIADVNKYITDNQAELAKLPPAEPEKDKATPGRENTVKNLGKIAKKLWGDKMAGIEGDVRFTNALTQFTNKLTEPRAKQLENPAATLTPKEQADLQKAFTEAFGYGNLEKVDDKEVTAINAMEVTINGQKKKFNEVFGDRLARVLSMGHRIEAGTPADKLKVDGQEVDAKGLTQYVPDSYKTVYTKKLNNTPLTDQETKDSDEALNNEEKSRQAMQELAKVAKNPRQVKAFENMGIGELISTLAQLWQMFQEAFASGDFKSLEDGLKDFTEGRNPADTVEKSKTEIYKPKVEAIKNTGDLISIYADPYGPKATELFKNAPYRIQVKKMVEEHLEAQLGVDISKMEIKTKNEIKLRASKGPKDYSIFLARADTQTFVTMDEIKLNNEGHEVTEPRVARAEVKDLKAGSQNLADTLFKGEEAVPAPTSTPKAPVAATAPTKK